ncbi:hypothetical protein HPB50_008528 [Hyalomma asiaticum]|uniref:Uncharacterized protein n=1 Tax=Hyalomma asiaticum TaxID=266040 RepID=A0ACB7RJU4_HYAAI|nr:hypothetical protein HPB50_008528 [Hyalomma asiaticum]
MAAPMADGCSSAVSVGSSQKRINWSVAMTEVLMRIWEDKLPALRSNTRNLRIYKEMVQALNASVPASEGPFSVKQVRQKLENLNKQYREAETVAQRRVPKELSGHFIGSSTLSSDRCQSMTVTLSRKVWR